MEEYQNISRDSLVQLDKQLQFAVFRSLTPENKKRIFNEKIDLLLATEDLTIEEEQHLILLRNYYDEEIYEREEGVTHAFLENWESYARLDLNWDDERLEHLYAHG